ncbi:MAG: membrane dipeptidase [Ruminococcaceae bacterium]|nr:membrane dipeptidase [Oscillospiraceae bacterium]
MCAKVIDLHCDTIDKIARSNGSMGLRDGNCDINLGKLRKGGAMAQFFAIFTRSHASLQRVGLTLTPYEYVQWIYACYQKELTANADIIAPAYTCNDILRNDEKGLMSSVLSVEDAVALEGKIERVDTFYQMGVRMMSLTWDWENSLGYPQSADPERMQLGLKPFGIDAVRRMEELGIIIDVSHLSDGGFWDVAKHTSAPFAASHSCARALCEKGRNLTDDMLRVIGDRGGVCGVNFYAGFLNKGSRYAAVGDIVRHAQYIANVAGVDAVALGSDFDGIDAEVEFHDYAGMPMLVDGLLRVFTEEEVEKICWRNALRVIRDVVK